MQGRILQALALAAIIAPLNSQAVPIIYDFQGTGRYVYTDGTPAVPAGLAGATEWDVRGSIIVDDDIAPTVDEPSIRLGQQIIGGSLSINGYDAGDFGAAYFSHTFLDGFEDRYPYQSGFSLDFAGGDFGPSNFWFHTEDYYDSGPDLNGVSLTDAGAFLRAVSPTDYSETAVEIGPWGGANFWQLTFDLTSEFIPRDEATQVPEPSPLLLFAIGLAIMAAYRVCFSFGGRSYSRGT